MTPGTLFVAGLNHRTAPVEVREQLALEEEKIREILADLTGRGLLDEVMILSTCNRVEVYGVAAVPGEARTAAFGRLGSHRGLQLARPRAARLHASPATRRRCHAFRVAASLDSMVLGEPQILGQVKDAFALAQSAGTAGPVLHALMSQAFSAAKRVRTETEVGRLAVSVSYAAVELARKIFDGLEGRAVLLVGAGEMSELAARHLVDHGALPLYVTNRTWSRAQELARGLGGTAVPVRASRGDPGPGGHRDHLDRRARADRHRAARCAPPLAGAPRRGRCSSSTSRSRGTWSPRSTMLENAFCYDIDDLRSVVEANLKERQREALRAQALLEGEVVKFAGRLQQLEVVPTIVSLREKLEAIRRAELERALGRLPGAGEETRRVMEALSQAIVNKVLHAPMVKLKDSSRAGHAPAVDRGDLRAVRAARRPAGPSSRE